jgi:hypothetical protein
MLDVSRRERVKRTEDTENGVLNIIQSLQETDSNRVIEEQAALLKMSTKKTEEEFRKAGFVIDNKEIEKQNNDNSG